MSTSTRLPTRRKRAAPAAPRRNGQESSCRREPATRSWASRHASAIRTGLFLVLLSGGLSFLYQPALNRVFVGDQLCYLLEMNGSKSLWDGLRHYDYALTRQYAKGDESLYRPLLFVWLAVNHWLFGNDYFWWNVVNLGLHLVVVMLLFALLRTLQPSPVAGAFALLFAVMPSQMDLTVWNHLGGYLAGFAFLLLALIAVQRVIPDAQPSRNRWLVVFTLSMTVAALFYELLVVASALVVLYLFYVEFRRSQGIRWRIVLASLVPGVVFTGLYIVHALNCPRLFFVDHPRDGGHVVGSVLKDAVLQNWDWLKQTLCPWDYAFIMRPYNRSHLELAKGPEASSTMVYWAIFACLLLIIGLWKTCHWKHLSRRIPLALTLVGMIGAYTTIVAVGRQGIYAANPYYLYFFAILLAVLIYILPDWSPEKVRMAPVLCAFAVLVIANASLTYNATTKLAKVNRGPDQFLTSLRQFVAEHGQEPCFSFSVNDFQNVDFGMGVTVGYPDSSAEQIVRPISGVVFPRCYNPTNPRYVLQWKNGTLTVADKRY